MLAISSWPWKAEGDETSSVASTHRFLIVSPFSVFGTQHGVWPSVSWLKAMEASGRAAGTSISQMSSQLPWNIPKAEAMNFLLNAEIPVPGGVC